MRPAIILAILLLAAPLAVSVTAWASQEDGPFAGPVAVTVRASRVGDVLQYSDVSPERIVTTERPRGLEHSTYIVQVEGQATVTDEFGLPRETNAYLVERAVETDDGPRATLHRCHDDGAIDAARRDLLGGYAATGETSFSTMMTFGETRLRNTTPLVSFRSDPCLGPNPLGGIRLREGERLSLLDLRIVFGLIGHPAPLHTRSEPAASTTFHGRNALEFRWPFASLGEDMPQGSIRAVVAAGLPGVVLLDIEGLDEDGATLVAARHRRELVAFERGAGPEIVEPGYYDVPRAHPGASFRKSDALSPGDDLFRLVFPYEEALDALKRDPSSGAAEYFRDNADAALLLAVYDAHASFHPARIGTTDGSWMLIFSAARDGAAFWLAAHDTVRAGGATAPLPARMVLTSGKVDDLFARSLTNEASVADAETLLGLVAAGGIHPPDVRFLLYVAAFDENVIDGRVLLVSDVSHADPQDREGRVVWLDASRGRILAIHSASVSAGPARPILAMDEDARLDDEPAVASGFLAHPAAGSGIAVVSAASGIAGLALLVKLVLLPLYTRLRRDRLLDHPVRARLYERVRIEPGLHRAELIEFAGIGDGATRHHLRQLVAHGLLVEIEDGGYARYYAAGEMPREVALRHALLQRGRIAEVHELYAAEPALPLREAARRLGMSAPSVHRARRRLVDAGLLPPAR